MKTKAMITMLVSVAMILTVPLVALGAPPDGKGGGGAGGGTGDAAGALYGDLYVIERDGKGEPLTRTVKYFELDENGDPTNVILEVACNQPLAKECGLLPLWGECNVDDDGIPDFELHTGILSTFDPASCVFNPEENDACAVYAGTEENPDPTYTDQLQPVSFGRESVSRSPAKVIDKSYAEALKTINQAAPVCGGEAAIKFDAAGRIMLCIPQETPGEGAWKTIDAPLENLGLYRAAMGDGCFGKVTEEVISEEGAAMVNTYVLDPSGIYWLNSVADHLVCEYSSFTIPTTPENADDMEASCTVTPDPSGEPDEPCGWESPKTTDRTAEGYQPGTDTDRDDMLSGAVFLAAGADKTSPVTLDEIINVNTYLGVNLWTYVRTKKETTLDVKYFPFGGESNWFKYTRGTDACQPGTLADLLVANSGSFTAGSVDVFGETPNSVDLRGTNGVPITVCRGGSPLLGTVCDSTSSEDTLGCGGANWFAQAAEDARKTIWYLHNWRVPEIAY